MFTSMTACQSLEIDAIANDNNPINSQWTKLSHPTFNLVV